MWLRRGFGVGLPVPEPSFEKLGPMHIVSFNPNTDYFINPRCACAARIIVLGSVCLSVNSHFTYGASDHPKNAVMYSAGNEGQYIGGDMPETTAFKSYAVKHERKSQYANFYDLPAVRFLCLTYSKVPVGTQRLSTTFNNPKQCLLLPLAHVGARTDSTTRTAGMANFRAHALALYTRCAACTEGFAL